MGRVSDSNARNGPRVERRRAVGLVLKRPAWCPIYRHVATLNRKRVRCKKDQQVTHTHTDREQHPRHRHTHTRQE